MNRGGAPPGERHGRAKLTDAKVRKLRERYAQGGISFLALAIEYDIADSTCHSAVTGKTWKHVTDLPPQDEAASAVSTT